MIYGGHTAAWKTVTHGGQLHCSNCDYKCSQKGNLTKHIASVHRPSDVLIEPVHEDEKLIKCSICDYTCPQEGDLTNHIASVHNGNYKIIPGCTKNAKVYQLDGFLYRVSSKRPRKGPTEKIYLICQEREETVEGKKVL